MKKYIKAILITTNVILAIMAINIMLEFINNNSKNTVTIKIPGNKITSKSYTLENEIELENEQIKKALQENSYAYYRKEKYIQYDNSRRTYNILPEDITSQRVAFSECSAFIYMVYYHTLGIELPSITNEMMAYAKYLYETSKLENIDSINKGIISYYDNFANEKFNNIPINSTSSAIGRATFKKNALEKLDIGDIIVYSTGTVGHALIVYDIVYDDNGSPIDALLLNSTTTDWETDTTKLYRGLSYTNAPNKGYSIGNTVIYQPTGINEGTIQMTTLTQAIYTARNDKYFTIIRPLLTNENGDYTGKYYKGTCIGSGNVANYEVSVSLEDYNLNETTKSRLKYQGIEIEKTVDIFNNSVVGLGDELTYSIKITNNSDKAYEDLKIVENISENITVIDYNNGIQNENTLTWDIYLDSKTTTTISYKVKVNKNYDNLGKVITSTGTVGNINSGTIKNYVSYNLNNKEKENLVKEYNKLKEKYNGIDLINKVYENAFGINLELSKFEFSKMLTLKNTYYQENSIILNKDYEYSKYILNNYYNALYKNSLGDYLIRYYENVNWNNKNRDIRADYIYPETLQTGDILIYNNKDDYITNENGLYAYIYINNMFYGITETNDGELKEITYDAFSTSKKGNNNLQTLFGKDYYVILRPSLKTDTTQMQLDIEYRAYDDNITVTIKSNEKMLEVEGWNLSEDEMTLTKVYTENTTEEVEIYDLAGNNKTAKISINNINNNAMNKDDVIQENSNMAPTMLPKAGEKRKIIEKIIISLILVFSIILFIKLKIYEDIGN